MSIATGNHEFLAEDRDLWELPAAAVVAEADRHAAPRSA